MNRCANAIKNFFKGIKFPLDNGYAYLTRGIACCARFKERRGDASSARTWS